MGDGVQYPLCELVPYLAIVTLNLANLTMSLPKENLFGLNTILSSSMLLYRHELLINFFKFLYIRFNFICPVCVAISTGMEATLGEEHKW